MPINVNCRLQAPDLGLEAGGSQNRIEKTLLSGSVVWHEVEARHEMGEGDDLLVGNSKNMLIQLQKVICNLVWGKLFRPAAGNKIGPGIQ